MKKILFIVAAAFFILTQCNKKNNTQTFEERVVVTNRGAGTLSYIDPNTNQVLQTQTITGSEPMYILYLPGKDRIFVGDRAQNKVHIINPANQSIETSIGVGSGVIHMSADAKENQLWVANDVSLSLSVISLSNNTVIQTINLGIKPHDVFLSSDGSKAYVSVQPGNGNPDSIYVFSTSSYAKLLSKAVGTLPHIYYSAINNKVYIANQSGTFLVLDPTTLAESANTPVPGAHGLVLSSDEKYSFIGNIVGDQLFIFNNSTNTIASGPLTSSVIPPVHNLAVNAAGDKLFVTHSGASSQSVSTYTIQNNTLIQGATITTGTNPNALVYYKRLIQ
jgi:YVTN family beta-propeller protein